MKIKLNNFVLAVIRTLMPSPNRLFDPVICELDGDGIGRNRTESDGFGRIRTDSDGFGRIWTDSDGFGRIWTDSDGVASGGGPLQLLLW